MSDVASAIRAATDRLSVSSDTARLDAELLMAHALAVSRSDMLVRAMRVEAPDGFDALVERRAAHEPVAYITGKTEFYGIELEVGPRVLIPRGDSESLIEAASEHFAERRPPDRILDLGTGSGALLIAAMSLFPDASGAALEKSPDAFTVAARNINRYSEGRALSLAQADWHDAGWADDLGAFDLILCNPPYVEDDAELDPDVREYEPASALFAGKDGLDDYRAIIPQLGKLLSPDGVAIFEIGASQANPVTEIAENAGFSVEMRRDLAKRPRVLCLTWPK